ncbi:hypothetical protein RLOC_00013608 [Lonchura striata]|uniref:Uncharacterized protein n=1 Tax=Lonchura striata TaxID=40157 RepID=A0A218VEL5_9PASE|nr:hypothetical protein RLOC_00013608 [Lonchura striata domestica]
MTEVLRNLYGCGVTDNKGPVLAWINTVETFRAVKLTTCGSACPYLWEWVKRLLPCGGWVWQQGPSPWNFWRHHS